jgi:glucose-6-phosphate 1-dehydrogenase
VDTDLALDSNPLLPGLERTPVRSTCLVIFGALGDLASRKLLPAIYNLAHEGALPERMEIVGVSRGDMSDDEFREHAKQSIERFSRRHPDSDVLDGLLRNVRFVGGSFDEADLYTRLRGTLESLDDGVGMPLNRVFYLSTAP